MKMALLAFLVLFGTPVVYCQGNRAGISLSGKVIDPYSGKPIPGVWVAVQGMHASGFMGGTEYFDDLALDSTDRNGLFRLKVPAERADSFIRRHRSITSLYRFALDLRTSKANVSISQEPGIIVFSRLFSVDSVINPEDRNNLAHRTFFLTGNDQRRGIDSSGLVVKFYRGGMIALRPENDTDYISRNRLYVNPRMLSGKDGVVLREDYVYLDKTSLKDKLLLPANVPLTMIFAKWNAGTQKEDTLSVIRNLVLEPGQVKEIVFPRPD